MGLSDAGRFAAEVADPRRHAVADFSVASDTMLILFGGIAGGVSMPVYEFFRVTDCYPVKRLFLRDPFRAWYLRGLPQVGTDAISVRDALSHTIREAGVCRVITAGASAGGFAALLFGAWIGAEAMIAFSPQSFLGEAARFTAADDRWAEQIGPLHSALGAEHPHYDVIPHLLAATRPQQVSIHVSTNDDLDRLHAGRMHDVPGLVIHEHRDGGHRLVKNLRDNGQLATILQAILAADGASGNRGSGPSGGTSFLPNPLVEG